MASRFWISGVASNWNNAANWAASSGGAGGAGVPNSGDDATFDGNGLGNCQMDLALSGLSSLTATSGYTGHLDASVDNLSHSISGNVTMDCTQFSMGSGTWTVSGNWDHDDVATFTGNGGTLVLDGTNKSIAGAGTGSGGLSNVKITGTINYDSGANILLAFLTTEVSGTLTISSGKEWRAAGTDALKITSTGKVTGAGTMYLQGVNLAQFDGVLDCAKFTAFSTTTLLAGTYVSPTVLFQKGGGAGRTITFASGTTTFTGNVTFDNDDAGPGDNFTVVNTTNNPNLVFQGNITFTELDANTMVWNKGTGTITLSGTSGTQTINTLGRQLEDVVINASGATKQLTSTLDCESFTLTAGTLDPNGQTITCGGNFTLQSGGTVTQTGLNGCTWTVTGNFSASSVNLDATAAWTLTVTGTATAMSLTVDHSNAGAGSEVQATNCTDGGNNTNWNFIAGGTVCQCNLGVSLSI